jgi:hypothetical protein
VFDVESRELEKDIHYYQSCLEAILQNSPEVFLSCRTGQRYSRSPEQSRGSAVLQNT